MAAINGVKKSFLDKNMKEKKNLTLAIIVICSMLFTILLTIIAWKVYLEDVAYDRFLVEARTGQSQALRATRDIAFGESIYGAVEVVDVPGNLSVQNAVNVYADLSALRASSTIYENAIITSNNTYDPATQDVVLDTSRQIDIDYISTPGVSQGDFVDIRLKTYTANSGNTYTDTVVCSKKEVLYKDATGVIELMLSESEILNLNNAVIEAVNPNQISELYVTKYVDPVNQPKAAVTYAGKGIQYTQEEIVEAQERLKNLQEGGGYNSPESERDTVVEEQ